MRLDKLNQSPEEEFITTLGTIFEHSPLVAKAVVGNRPFATVENLHQKMVATVDNAGDEEQLKLIRAHPDLAGKAALAGGLTEESTSEQAGAGLDLLNETEYRHFHSLNDAYQSRFGFPFIIAVKGHDKHSILDAFRKRLENDKEAEKETALKQIYRIAKFRLEDLIET